MSIAVQEWRQQCKCEQQSAANDHQPVQDHIQEGLPFFYDFSLSHFPIHVSTCGYAVIGPYRTVHIELYIFTRFTSKHMFLARFDKTHTSFTLIPICQVALYMFAHVLQVNTFLVCSSETLTLIPMSGLVVG